MGSSGINTRGNGNDHGSILLLGLLRREEDVVALSSLVADLRVGGSRREEKTKKEDATMIIAIASGVGLIALIAVVVGVLFFVKRYRASNAAFQAKFDETENADSILGSSPLYEG